MLVLGLSASSGAACQPPPPADAQPAADEDAPPAPAEAMRAYRALRGWLDSWAVPAAPPPGLLPTSPGAAVILRFDGKTIGRGVRLEASWVAMDRDEASNRTVWHAFLEAFGEADKRIPVARDVLRPQQVREAAKTVQVSIELAGVPTPVEPATFSELDSMVAPGLEGVAVRVGNRIEAAFPSAMLLANASPSEAARGLVSKVTGSAGIALGEAKDLREKQQVVFMRFRVVHLAQNAPGMEPRFLFRGGRVCELGEIDVASLRGMADGLARHLRTRAIDGDAPLGMKGSYRPWSGEYEQKFALPHEQALAALALRRYAGKPWVAPAAAKAAAGFADHLLHDLDDVDLDEAKPWDDVGASALAVLALRESDGPFGGAVQAAQADLLVRCGDRLRSAWDPAKGFDPALSPPLQGALAAAWLRLEHKGGEDATAPLRRVLRDTQPGALAGLMPLVGWAEVEAAGGKAIPSAPALRQLRSQLWAAQITSGGAQNRADLVGGVPTLGPGGGLPTWTCLRPLAFAATMLRVPELTARDEVGVETARLINAARYLRQLQVDEQQGWMLASAPRALGGIRAAAWDQSMPPDATSVGLLAACELLESLETLAGR